MHGLGLAAANICFEATVRGLFVHQMIRILPDRVRELYEVPDGHERVTALTIGRFINRTSVGRGISKAGNTGTNPVFLFKFTTFGGLYSCDEYSKERCQFRSCWHHSPG